jgi:hypothetical protein
VRPNRRSVALTVADETYFDDDLLAGEALSTQRLDNPFGTRLSPMS